MSVYSTLRIHLTFSGDFTADVVYNMENPNSPGIVFYQPIIGAQFTTIFNPLPLPGTILTGLIIIPPRTNTHIYNLVTDVPGGGGGIQQSMVVFHPTNPSIFSISDVILPIKISHNGPLGYDPVFQFIWI